MSTQSMLQFIRLFKKKSWSKRGSKRLILRHLLPSAFRHETSYSTIHTASDSYVPIVSPNRCGHRTVRIAKLEHRLFNCLGLVSLCLENLEAGCTRARIGSCSPEILTSGRQTATMRSVVLILSLLLHELSILGALSTQHEKLVFETVLAAKYNPKKNGRNE
ncbi:uncharacterized protein PHALS_04314 [Plasmopara halstedii]|uniref:Uncharacterized protein n=1 Tax=Plasmopara halstedii TaxID=4781 RepID=A0A0P1B224_PLAHL|nr:uncharacterized protein PHALS_04314 [Plasmopara halstedii]CEG47439.1 hypothetical protein PHALS_04314 [Plasmopara halstedii]|eukprot:XP_024583808.1 hypothetical protein PHALS_04314 [Plasmopara halstedii]